MKESRRKNKFQKLNFNLKNIIFSFLCIHFLLTEIPKVSRKILSLIKRNDIYKYLSKNIHFLSKNILYDSEFLENFKKKIKNNYNANDNNNISNKIKIDGNDYDDFIRFLLLVKYNNLHYFYLKEDKILNKYSDFLIYSTNIKKLILKEERYNYDDIDFETIFICISKILDKNKNINALQFNKGFLKITENIEEEIF